MASSDNLIQSAKHVLSQLNKLAKLRENSDNLIERGIDEVNMLIQVAACVQSLEAEKENFKLIGDTLCEENTWLREELARTQKNLQEHEQKLAECEVKLSHLEFLNELDQLDPHFHQEQEQLLVQLIPSDESCRQESDSYSLFFASILEQPSMNVLDTINLPSMFNTLATACREQKHVTDAISLLNQALAMQDRQKSSSQAEHKTMAVILNNMTALLVQQRKFKEAETFSRRLLHLKTNILGADQLDVAQQCTVLAALCQSQAQYAEAEQLYLRAILIYARNLGQDDLSVAKTKNKLVCASRVKSQFLIQF
jgi:tetratricopeptide (TPR) repeat protein